MTLARGLVWCRSCQVRTALSDAGGKCPVCDPDQGNRVSANADAELERIDAVLAGNDTRWEGAEWRADGSHQDEELLPWQDAFLHRRIIHSPFYPVHFPNDPIHQGNAPVRVRASGDTHGDDGWHELGVTMTDVMFGFDGSRDDDAITFGRMHVNRFSTLTVQIIPVSHQFSDALFRILFGPDWYYSEREALDRWEDDGGPMA